MKNLILVCCLLLTRSAWAQQGTIEYKMTLGNGGAQGMTSSSTLYFANGNVRTDATMALPGATRPIKQSVLMLKSNPKTMVTLNEANHTYTETEMNTVNSTTNGKTTVKILGKETVQNLPCTHVLLSFAKGGMEVWTTKAIPGYESLASFWKTSRNFGSSDVYSELVKNGADGFFVKMKSPGDKGGMNMELVRYDPRPVSAALFIIPKGYQKTEGFDPEKMKNMSPAERQKLMQEMMKQYGGKQ